MSLVEGGRKLEDFGEKPESGDLSGLFGESKNNGLTQEEINEFTREVAAENKMRQLTPEIVSSAWESLNYYEKRFVTAPQEQFDKLIDDYEAAHGPKRKNLVTGLRKLIESGNPLAAEIRREPKWEKTKEEEKEKIAA